MTSTLMRRIAFAALFASVAWSTAPRLVRLTAEAVQLVPLSYAQRRARVLGPFADLVKRLRTELPPDQPVALMLKGGSDVNVAIFFNYYMYPLRSRIYGTLGAWRNEKERPEILLNVDESSSPQVKWMPYAELRADRIGAELTTARQPDATALLSFAIPSVASLDGPDPDMYVTEAIVTNESALANRVHLELFPSGRTREVALLSHERKSFSDLVYQSFGVMERGWLRVRAEHPVRAGFWFVNRGRGFSSSLPLMKPARDIRLRAPVEARFEIINPGDAGMMVRVNDEEFYVGPHETINGWKIGDMHFRSDAEFYAFASWRESDGGTVFAWP